MARVSREGEAEKAGCDVAVTGEGVLLLSFTGAWRMDSAVPGGEPRRGRGKGPDLKPVRAALAAGTHPPRALTSLAFDTARLTGWDSTFLSHCRGAQALAAKAGVAVDLTGLPHGAAALLELAAKVPERKGIGRKAPAEPLLARVGAMALNARQAFLDVLEFLGDMALSGVRLAQGRAIFQRSTLTALVQQSGLEALPIVSLISLLVGLILAFVGAIQLRQFGAQIYVSTLVGVAMIRVMGAIMTGIIMAGRTGAAFAAELGTMQVNEEIDALRTFGFSPTEFLVLPRLLALVLMMPLLCVYADLMGILGGFVVGVFMLDINPLQYLTSTWDTVPLANFWIGMVHCTVFGVLISLAGCYRGMRCGRSAQAVGQATTSAVVTSILSIVVATAIITVICEVIGV